MGASVLKGLGFSLVIGLVGTVSASAAPGIDLRATAIGPAHPAVLLAQTTAAAKPSSGSIVTVPAPAVTPFVWSATKASDGSVGFAGYVPSKDVHDSLVDGIGQIGADNTSVASGAPEEFAADALGALQVLNDLDSGKVAYDGSIWTITGAVDSADKAGTAQKAFDDSPLKALSAKYEVTAPAAATAAAPAPAASAATATAPVAAPAQPAAATPPAAAPVAVAPATGAAPAADYAWSAEKAADGKITFAGKVPNTILKGFLVNHTKDPATDNSTVAEGAPMGFVGGAYYGLDALTALDSGKLAFADGKWSLVGIAKDESSSKMAVETLGSIIDTKAWTFDIKTAPAPAAAPAATSPAPAAAAAPVAAPAEPYVFSASKIAGGAIVLAGEVPTEGARGYFGDIVGNVPTDDLKVVPNAPAGFITNALAGLDALGALNDGKLDFDGKAWSLKGGTTTDEARTTVLAHIAALPDGKTWAVDVAGPTEAEICRAKLTDSAKTNGNAINFDTKTHFAKGVDAVLDAVATDLAACPNTRVDIEGHTDTDGDANANMALSVARAEAVIDALVKRGIKADRLYAVGYGETLPLVPNTTKANKAKNRRIAFKVVDAPKN